MGIIPLVSICLGIASTLVEAKRMSMVAVASTKNELKVLENMVFVEWLNVRSG